jgi:hypothetical protein
MRDRRSKTMKKRALLIIAPLLLAILLSAYAMPSGTTSRPASSELLQTTPLPTVLPPVSTVVVVPVTGGSDTSTLLFYGILVLAGIAFLIMLFALMRRPHDHDHL